MHTNNPTAIKLPPLSLDGVKSQIKLAIEGLKSLCNWAGIQPQFRGVEGKGRALSLGGFTGGGVLCNDLGSAIIFAPANLHANEQHSLRYRRGLAPGPLPERKDGPALPPKRGSGQLNPRRE